MRYNTTSVIRSIMDVKRKQKVICKLSSAEIEIEWLLHMALSALHGQARVRCAKASSLLS
ncbi:hypothetical protein RJ640_000558 [Escallonia rubra]|uniref:Uncharacterized protein n=1 Tax=Escallonia rubra TaxID=112253 RepID=A0AA88UQ57_9ASTE|nr:hypothetical protein RJ640_000558 [Escallonia rubra]